MIKPISPDEVFHVIPEKVIDVVNNLIKTKWNGYEAVIYQETIVNNLVELDSMDRNDIFNNHYLDIEPLYRTAGWNVEYHSPAYNENWKPYFRFMK